MATILNQGSFTFTENIWCGSSPADPFVTFDMRSKVISRRNHYYKIMLSTELAGQDIEPYIYNQSNLLPQEHDLRLKFFFPPSVFSLPFRRHYYTETLHAHIAHENNRVQLREEYSEKGCATTDPASPKASRISNPL